MNNPNKNALATNLGGINGKGDISKYYGIDYNLRPQDCKQFAKCNAPICPFDRNWRNRKYFRGESVCFYLKEYSKPYIRPILRGVIGKNGYQVIAEAYPEVVLTYNPIKVVLERASRNSSKLVKPLKTQVA